MINSSETTKIVFDFDGVLVDSNEIKEDCFFEVARRYGGSVFSRFKEYCDVNPSETRYEKMQWLERELENNDIDTSYEELLDQYGDCVKVELQKTENVSNLKELKESNSDETWSIVSAGAEEEIKWFLEEMDWLELFEDGVHGAPRSKAEIFEEEYDGTELRQSVKFLGDSKSDHEVAKQFGIDFVFVSHWSRDPQLAESADVTGVSSVSECFES